MVPCSVSGHQIGASRGHTVERSKGMGPPVGPTAAAVKVTLSYLYTAEKHNGSFGNHFVTPMPH